MRTRCINQHTLNALKARVAHDGLIRSSVFLAVGQRTLAKVLRGEPVSVSIAARLEAVAAT